MKVHISRQCIFACLSFILTPPLVIGVIGLLARSQTVDIHSAVISNLLIPIMFTGFLAAIIGWAVFMRPPIHLPDGKKAGQLTVFLCYAFCILPLAIEAVSWDGLVGIAVFYFMFFVIFQIATFWIAYPIGIIFGRWFAKKLMA